MVVARANLKKGAEQKVVMPKKKGQDVLGLSKKDYIQKNKELINLLQAKQHVAKDDLTEFKRAFEKNYENEIKDNFHTQPAYADNNRLQNIDQNRLYLKSKVDAMEKLLLRKNSSSNNNQENLLNVLSSRFSRHTVKF